MSLVVRGQAEAYAGGQGGSTGTQGLENEISNNYRSRDARFNDAVRHAVQAKDPFHRRRY